MAENKKQHYVPRFYLKNFAADNRQRAINILNIKSERPILGARLASQCHRDYFYGSNLIIEKGLGILEGQTSTLFRDIIKNHEIPREPSQRTLLAIYLVLQRLRTVAAVNRSEEMYVGLLKVMLQEKFSEEAIAGIRLRFREGAALNTGLAFLVAPILFDLEPVLLINNRDIEFVASDNPVVHANRFCELRYPGLGEGLSTSGLMVILPLTPKLALLLFDKGIYDLKHIRNRTISRLTDSDILKLNELQALNALDNLYFSSPDQSESVAAVFEDAKSRRHSSLAEVQELVISNTPGTYVLPGSKDAAPKKTESLVVGSHIGINAKIDLSFLRFRFRKKYHDDGSAAGPVRDPAWVEIIDNFSRAVEDQGLGYGHLERYAREHALWPNVGSWKKGLFGV